MEGEEAAAVVQKLTTKLEEEAGVSSKSVSTRLNPASEVEPERRVAELSEVAAALETGPEASEVDPASSVAELSEVAAALETGPEASEVATFRSEQQDTAEATAQIEEALAVFQESKK